MKTTITMICSLCVFLCVIGLVHCATQVSCVGDSITVAGYPTNLQALLGNTYKVDNFGVSGTTMLKQGDNPYWNQQAYKNALASNPAVVVIMLGTNDAKPYNWVYGGNYSRDYASMIESFRVLPSKPAIHINTPPPVYIDGQFSISQHNVNDVIVPLVWQIAAENKVGLIDVFNATGGLQLTHPNWFYDGIHPNADGNAGIAAPVAAALKK